MNQKVPKFHSSESVSVGHSDFVATSVADALIDAYAAQDEDTHAGVEVLLTTNRVVLAGEVTTKASIDYEKVVRDTIASIGYVNPETQFDSENVVIENYIHSQSPDINQGVSRGNGVIGAGDQGIIFGFAVNDTEDYYPFNAALANQLMRNYTAFQLQDRKTFKGCEHSSARFYPDAKAQVTFDYSNNRIDTILLAVSHCECLSEEQVREIILKEVLTPTLEQVCFKGHKASELVDDNTKILINTTGKFVICGPHGDAGITNRKITVDQYGGHARIGGGGLHGKDATKTDFSAAVGARHAAKNLVAAGVADKAEIQVAYAIGQVNPLSVSVDTFGTSKIDYTDEEISEILSKNYDFSPAGLIKNLNLKTISRISTNTNYFFGVAPSENSHSWEKLDYVDTFKKCFKID